MRRALPILLVLSACGRPVLGNTAAAELRVEPRDVDFGEVYAGQRVTATLRVQNAGKVGATADLSFTPPFDGPAAIDVPGGSAIEVVTGFRPIAEGAFALSLQVGEQTVALHGTAKAALVCRAEPTACVTSTFDPDAAACVEAPKPDQTACATRCVSAGTCAAGECHGPLMNCADTNACTDDHCSEELGCLHTPKVCPGSTTNPCRVPSCDPVKGCLLTDATDGTPCGPKSCRTNSARVCIAAQCVDRPLPTSECLQQFGYLKATNSREAHAFGIRVALSADGTTLAIGATGEPSCATGIGGDQTNLSCPQSGAVYVYVRAGGAWQAQAFVKATNTDQNDAFGYALALSADGDVLVVGAHLEDGRGKGTDGDPNDDSEHDSGAAYVYRRTDGVWAPEAYLKASNTGHEDDFGASLAVSGDGETIAIGANAEDSKATGLDGNQADDSAGEAGAVYVFRRLVVGWRQEAYVKASVVEGGDRFGHALALSDDGNVLAVSAPGDDSKSTGVDGDAKNNGALQSGAVWLFRRGLEWQQQSYFKASNTGAGDAFGIALALSSDGKTLAVGAYGEDSSATGVNGVQTDNAASQSGAAYVFVQKNGGWTQQAYFKAFNTSPGDDFGFALALSGDATALAVGAWSENSGATGIDGHAFNANEPDSGALYLFRRGFAGWAREAYLKASNTQSADDFGYAVALSSDGTTVAVAAIGEDSGATGVNGPQSDNSASESGAVYVFSRQ